MSDMFNSYSDKSSLKHIIILPREQSCCGKPLLIRNRPSFPLVYTCNGTLVAAAFTGECHMSCSKKFSYSFFQEDDKIYYYSPDDIFFQLSSQTIFEVKFLKDVTNNVSISATSFQSRAEVYNENFREIDGERLKCLSQF